MVTYVNKMATIVAYSFLLALLILWTPPGQAYPDGGRRICENTSNCAKELALLKGGLIFVKLDFSAIVEGVLLILDAHLFGDTRIRNVAADFEFTTFTSYLLATCIMFFTPCSLMKSIVSLSPLRFVITSVYYTYRLKRSLAHFPMHAPHSLWTMGAKPSMALWKAALHSCFLDPFHPSFSFLLATVA